MTHSGLFPWLQCRPIPLCDFTSTCQLVPGAAALGVYRRVDFLGATQKSLLSDCLAFPGDLRHLLGLGKGVQKQVFGGWAECGIFCWDNSLIQHAHIIVHSCARHCARSWGHHGD